MKEKSELKKEFQKIMKQHYFLKSDPELPYDNILSCMEDAYNLDRPTPVVEAKTAEEIKKVILSKIKELKTFMHNEDVSTIKNSYYVSIQHMYGLIRDFDAQYTPSAKSVDVEEAAIASIGRLNDDSYLGSKYKEQFIAGSSWQQQKQADTISQLTESLKTIYSLAKPGSAIYEICDKTLNPKNNKTDK